MGIRLQ